MNSEREPALNQSCPCVYSNIFEFFFFVCNSGACVLYYFGLHPATLGAVSSSHVFLLEI